MSVTLKERGEGIISTKNTNIEVNQFAVFWIDLPPVKEIPNLQSGVKPCVVVSNNACNKYSPVITVVPITSSRQKRDLPTHREFDKLEREEIGLTRDSTLLGETIRTVGKDLILGKIGNLNNTAKRKAISALKVQLGMV